MGGAQQVFARLAGRANVGGRHEFFEVGHILANFDRHQLRQFAIRSVRAGSGCDCFSAAGFDRNAIVLRVCEHTGCFGMVQMARDKSCRQTGAQGIKFRTVTSRQSLAEVTKARYLGCVQGAGLLQQTGFEMG